MNTLPAYIVYISTLRIYLFFKNWYFFSLLLVSRKTINLLSHLDTYFALPITVKHIFSPLYQDYTVIGYLISIPTRIVMVIFGSITYLIVILLAISIYLIWILIPILLIYKTITTI